MRKREGSGHERILEALARMEDTPVFEKDTKPVVINSKYAAAEFY